MQPTHGSVRRLALATALIGTFLAAVSVRADERALASGRNPDIAVDGAGNLHLAYMSGTAVVYARVNPSLGTLEQRVVGDSGDAVNGNPHIALDNLGNPHFLWADRTDRELRYTFLQGSVQGPTTTIRQTCGDCPGIRKPAIAVDQNTNVAYLYYEDRRPYVRIALGGIVSDRFLIGASSSSKEDAGGVAVGSDGSVHFTLRTSGALFYRNVSAVGLLTGIETAAGDGASDFSDVDTDAFDGSVAKIAGLQSGREGDNLRYIVRRGGQYSILQFGSQFVASENHDGVGPSLAVDRNNVTYFTWSGGRDRSFYQIIGPDDRLVGTVQALGNANSHQGGKFTYPAVDDAPCGGAWAAWEDDRSGNYEIFVRDIDVPAGFCSSKPPVIAMAGWGASSNSLFQAIAVVSDPEGDVNRVELLINDAPTNIFLNDSGSGGDAITGDGVWTLQQSGGLNLPPGRYLIGMRAIDSQGSVSDPWPYFNVGAQRRLEPSEYPTVELIRDQLDAALEQMGIQSGATPRILLAGYMDTNISATQGGVFRIVARADGAQVTQVETMFAGVALPGPVVLLDNGAQGDFQGGDGYFTFTANGLPPVTVSGRVPLELVARDLFGGQSTVWPYLTVP